jgi:hypothetical protein
MEGGALASISEVMKKIFFEDDGDENIFGQ